MRDITGKVIVITGGSSGIGAAAARQLAKMGAKVVITGRSQETEKLAREIGGDFFLVDFTKLADVRKFATDILAKYPRIDVLVNNVGGIFGNYRKTSDGHETTFQVNHLAGFLLTQLLRDRLEASNAVIINTSSIANNLAKLDLSDLESERGYSDGRAYANAKMMNILHAMEINKRFKNVKAVSFHPGAVRSGFGREGSTLAKLIYETPLKNLILISPEKGADTLVWLIASEPGKDWTPGDYYRKRKPGRRNKQVTADLATKLWDASEKLTHA